MITYYYRNLKETKLTALEGFRTGCWVHVHNPTQEEIAQLVDQQELEEGHLRDALDPDEVPRLETEGDTTYVFTRFSYNQDGRLQTAPMLFVVTPKCVVTVTTRTVPSWELFTADRIEIITTQKTKLLLQLIRHTVGTYNSGLTTINRQIRAARANLNVANVSNRNFVQFVGIEDALNDFLSELVPTNAILSNLLAGKQKGLIFYEDDRDIVEDLVLSTRQSIENSKSNLRTIVNIREAYSNIMTNNLNRQIKLLTSMTIILMIPNIISGFFGMNVPVPLHNYRYGFEIVIAGTIAMCAYLIWLFNRNKWL